MTLVSLSDCCHLLAVDPKTLRRWMSLFHLSAQPHPSDARIKCVTFEQIQQLASTHHRMLLDRGETHFQQEIAVPTAPVVVSAPVLADVPMNVPHLIPDLITQLDTLQAYVVTLQHQLTHLSDQLQKEQAWRRSQPVTEEEKSPESSREKSQGSSQEKSQESPREKSQESSREKSQESPREKSQESSRKKSQESSREKSQESSREKSQVKELESALTSTPEVGGRKRSQVLPLVECGEHDKYVVISPEQGLLEFSPDSDEWFAWLSTLSSFRFVGASGHFTTHRDSPGSSWRATRSIRSRSRNLRLVRTESLTIAVLEQAAASLQSLLN